jgi:two-component system response regulator GlrR
MKPVHILITHWGTEEGTDGMLAGVLSSTPGDGVELAELTVSYPVSDQEAERVSEAVAGRNPDLLVLLLAGDAVVQKGASFFELASRNRWRMPIVVVCPTAKPHELVVLRKLGASEVLTMLWGSKEAMARLVALTGHAHEGASPVGQLRARLGLEHVIGESPAFVALIQQLPAIAKYDVSLLILGETGTGKEVFARTVHYRSPRASKPFIPVNCGAIPVELLENEFFGHESGAFTSANCSRRGVIKEADGGTLFLDEVDCLLPLAQVKLLRFLQDGQFRPLGSASVCMADVRIIAASNANFAEALASGRFRKDLYYRLNVLSLKLPPLREREGDIVLLARHFLAKYTDKFGAPARVGRLPRHGTASPTPAPPAAQLRPHKAAAAQHHPVGQKSQPAPQPRPQRQRSFFRLNHPSGLLGVDHGLLGLWSHHAGPKQPPPVLRAHLGPVDLPRLITQGAGQPGPRGRLP